jgi:hypothetical protein
MEMPQLIGMLLANLCAIVLETPSARHGCAQVPLGGALNGGMGRGTDDRSHSTAAERSACMMFAEEQGGPHPPAMN